MNEEKRGDRNLPVGLAGVEDSRGAAGRRRRRGFRAPAVEWKALTEAPGSGEAARVLGEARQWLGSPELRRELVGDGGGAEEIGDNLGAERKSGLGEMTRRERRFILRGRGADSTRV